MVIEYYYFCSDFNCKPESTDNFIYSVGTSICATILFLLLYEFIWKNLISYYRNRKYKGTYKHYKADGTPCIYAENHNYSEIEIKFWKRDILFINSFDYNNPSGGWRGEIKIDSSRFMNGIGTYSYNDNSTMGNHRIHALNDRTIFVQILDYRGLGNPNLWIENLWKTMTRNSWYK